MQEVLGLIFSTGKKKWASENSLQVLRAASHLTYLSSFRCQFEMTEELVNVHVLQREQRNGEQILILFPFTSTFHSLKSLTQRRDLSVSVWGIDCRSPPSVWVFGLAVVALTFNPSTWEVQARGSAVQGHRKFLVIPRPVGVMWNLISVITSTIIVWLFVFKSYAVKG